MDNLPDHLICFNLFLCFYATGDVNKMKSTFNTLCSIELHYHDEDTDLENQDVVANEDPLAAYMKEKQKEAINAIVTAGRLLAPLINPEHVT